MRMPQAPPHPVGVRTRTARVPTHRKAKIMEVCSILQRPSRTRLLQGAAAGAVVTMIVGFNWGGRSRPSPSARQGAMLPVTEA
jgi:hypothetical protein